MCVSDVLCGRSPWKVETVDAVSGLREMPSESVHCVVTSPPYYSLRDYGVAGQIGLESSVGEYLAKMVDLFDEVRRVLRDDGTCWVNMGDSYNANGRQGHGTRAGFKQGTNRASVSGSDRSRSTDGNLKPKDKMLVPWRLVLMLQSAGWCVRDVIVWHKPAPMPESVNDRCTQSWEPIFLLAKRAKYYYDAEAVKESGCNLRNVWTLSPEPFSGAHFATFPTELPRRCIKAGTSEWGCCAKCGAPWRRMTEREKLKRERPNDYTKRTGEAGTGNSCGNTVAGVAVTTIGWQPTCKCGVAEVVPAIVMDIFNGSGTTGLVARRLGRRYVGLELNPEYADMSRRRIIDDAPLFNS